MSSEKCGRKPTEVVGFYLVYSLILIKHIHSLKPNRSLPENGWFRDKTVSFWSPLPILRCSNLLLVLGSGILVYIMCKIYINWKIEISRTGDFSYLSYSKGLIHIEIFHLQLLFVYRYFQEPFAHSQKTTINFAVSWENPQFFTSNSGVSLFCCEKKPAMKCDTCLDPPKGSKNCR